MSGTLGERLNKILPRIISDEFLSGSGIGNEIAFYIFDYPPEDELRVRDFLLTLLDHIPKQKHGMRVKHIDLFDFMLDHLRSRNLLDKAIQLQREKGDQALKKALSGPLHESKLSQPFAETAKPEWRPSAHRAQSVASASGRGRPFRPSPVQDGSTGRPHPISAMRRVRRRRASRVSAAVVRRRQPQCNAQFFWASIINSARSSFWRRRALSRSNFWICSAEPSGFGPRFFGASAA